MSNLILVVAEHDNASLKGATLNTVTAAAEIAKHTGGAIHVLVAGYKRRCAAAQAAQVQGVAQVLHADAAQLEHGLAENVAPQVLAAVAAGGYSHILFASTARGKNIAPRVAAKLDVAQISDITRVDAADTFERPIYAGNAMAVVQSSRCGQGDHRAHHRLRCRCHRWLGRCGHGKTPWATAARAALWARNWPCQRPARTHRGQDHSCRRGRALGSAEKFNEVMTPLADKLGAALGASRAAVDAGYAPNDWQVGQTGKIVAPSLYIAAGISGAIQHLAGMKDSKVIVAINKDPEAPIFSVADYSLEADLFEAVPELVKSL
jgi:electron transfer flavoprotein alpha subunit